MFTSQVDPESIEIAGYNLLTDNRKFSNGGGVALYVKANVNYMLRDDLKIDIVNIWVDTQDLTNFFLQFLDEFEQVLHSIFLSQRKCLILGDIKSKCPQNSNIVR